MFEKGVVLMHIRSIFNTLGLRTNHAVALSEFCAIRALLSRLSNSYITKMT